MSDSLCSVALCAQAYGGHGVSFEIIDAMWAPSKYDVVYPLSYLFTFMIAAPHSVLVQLAYPKANLAQGARLLPARYPSCSAELPQSFYATPKIYAEGSCYEGSEFESVGREPLFVCKPSIARAHSRRACVLALLHNGRQCCSAGSNQHFYSHFAAHARNVHGISDRWPVLARRQCVRRAAPQRRAHRLHRPHAHPPDRRLCPLCALSSYTY